MTGEFSFLMREPRGEPRLTVLALHGFGSNAADLFNLAPRFGKDVRFLALDGPIDLATLPELFPWQAEAAAVGTYAWYALDLASGAGQPGSSTQATDVGQDGATGAGDAGARAAGAAAHAAGGTGRARVARRTTRGLALADRKGRQQLLHLA